MTEEIMQKIQWWQDKADNAVFNDTALAGYWVERAKEEIKKLLEVSDEI